MLNWLKQAFVLERLVQLLECKKISQLCFNLTLNKYCKGTTWNLLTYKNYKFKVVSKFVKIKWLIKVVIILFKS